jgi:subtilisin family serine protease
MILALMLSIVPAAFAQENLPTTPTTDRPLPASVSSMVLDEIVTLDSADGFVVDPSLAGATGSTRVVVRLRADSIAERSIYGRSAQRMGLILSYYQDRLLDRIFAIDPSATVIAQTQLVLNAVFLEVDGSKLSDIARDSAVERIAPIGDYELDLTETVPYIGGSAVQSMGFDGTGIRVAVLDSGIDYLHYNLGGSGDPDEFAANDPSIIEPGSFPTAKVVGGYDFVGSNWPNTPEQPDPDPLDDGVGGGHGTHVADIIGGMNGVAPGVDLYAVKVCSSVSTSCSGVALIQGMEFAADPNGDGDPSDAVDVINMSLGSSYGQPFDDDLVAAVDATTALGVLTVASAGNSSDKPYATGTPAGAISALSVAQTAVPSATQPILEVVAPAGMETTFPAVFQPWSVPPAGRIEAALQYGDGAGGNLLGCSPFAAGSLSGKIVLVDRGVCSFSIKIENIGNAGAVAGIIGLVAPGDPFEGGYGGGVVTIPGYMISQVNSNYLKSGLASGIVVAFDPANDLPLVMTMVGSSSRGPRNQDNFLKPEIGAPGASVSAIAGSGTDTGAFGGTSGAAPMVTGSAALLLQAYPSLIPAEVKARLMNTGETMIRTNGIAPDLAPISRIGGGEVRVDRALSAPAAAWDDATLTGSLSFGFLDVSKNTVELFKQVRVRNYSTANITYNITPTFRFADDAETGAVIVDAPKSVFVKAGSDATFTVKMTIKGELLRGNYMNSGSAGADPVGLNINEFDGYLVLSDGQQEIHMPWHVLPRKAADVIARPGLKFDREGNAMVNVVNRGVGTAQISAFSLLAVSEDLPEGGLGQQSPTPDIRAFGIQTYYVPANLGCGPSDSFLWEFAVNSWERQTHLVPVSYWVYLDINQDGFPEYAVLNRDVSVSNVTDGRQLSWLYNLSTGSLTARFYAEHATNTGNTILRVCGSDLGLTLDDAFTNTVDVAVEAQDFYFGGPGDYIDGMTVSPFGERYYAMVDDVPGKQKTFMNVVDFGDFPGNNNDLGILLITNSYRGSDANGGATQDTEAVLVLPR